MLIERALHREDAEQSVVFAKRCFHQTLGQWEEKLPECLNRVSPTNAKRYVNVKKFDTTETSDLIGIGHKGKSFSARAYGHRCRKYVSFSFFPSRGNKFSFRASYVYQDRRFKFIPVAACTAGAHCSSSLRRCNWMQYIETSGAGLRISLPSFLRIFVCAWNAIFLAAWSLSALSWSTRLFPFASHIIPFEISVGHSHQKAIPQPRIWLYRYARTANTATICQMFNCWNVRQYIYSIVAPDVSAFVCVYKFTRCLRDTYTLFTLPTSNLEFERVYGFWVSHVRN